MQLLTCGYQGYAWGKTGDSSRVAALVGERDAHQRYAELWMGTHPSKPSFLRGTETPLKVLLEADASALDDKHVAQFGKDIPFLLKVLSIDKALSIQAHPAKDHARKLHAADPKNYPDPNHKPELVVALTQFEALCCFRPIAEIIAFVDAIAPLKALLPDFVDVARAAIGNGDKEKSVLKAAMSRLYRAAPDTVAAGLTEHLTALSAMAPTERSDAQRVFVRTHEQFPGDIGCWMVYFLNLLHLQPGEGLFMAPNEPHAYLSGDCVEVMATSDNVVRAGLTPKFKDVDTLLEMMTYRTDSLSGVRFHPNGQPVQVYGPPAWCTEFVLHAVCLGQANPRAAFSLPSASIGIVVEGSCTVNGKQLTAGDIVFLPASVENVGLELGGEATASVYFATTNLPREPAGKL